MRSPIELKLDSFKLTDEQFYQLCQDNRDLKFERNVTGNLSIMSPTGGETGERNSEINFQLRFWNKQFKRHDLFCVCVFFCPPQSAYCTAVHMGGQ
ncbi:MAG: Uma2 family endonuclease, partial [Cyanobacteria bacterium P01_G01_bin.49]